VAAVLDGRQPKVLRVVETLRNVPLSWEKQRTVLGFDMSDL
jgi:hypothetical protein